MTTFIRYTILLLFCSWAKAGNNPALTSAKEDFKRVNDMYAKAEGLSMDTYYKVFTDHYSQSMIEGKNGTYVKYDKNLYTKIDNIETYLIDDKVISINPDNKQITVGDNKTVELAPIQTNLDTLLALCENIKMEQVNENERKYKLFFGDEGSEFTRVDVNIDTKNNCYLKITLYYALKMNLKEEFYAEQQAPRLEVSYKNLKFLQAAPSIFNQGLYVLNVDGTLKPTAKYYNFKVSDLRNETRIKTKPKTR